MATGKQSLGELSVNTIRRLLDILDKCEFEVGDGPENEALFTGRIDETEFSSIRDCFRGLLGVNLTSPEVSSNCLRVVVSGQLGRYHAYPACKTSELFCKISGRPFLDSVGIKAIQNLGYTIVVVG